MALKTSTSWRTEHSDVSGSKLYGETLGVLFREHVSLWELSLRFSHRAPRSKVVSARAAATIASILEGDAPAGTYGTDHKRSFLHFFPATSSNGPGVWTIISYGHPYSHRAVSS